MKTKTSKSVSVYLDRSPKRLRRSLVQDTKTELDNTESNTKENEKEDRMDNAENIENVGRKTRSATRQNNNTPRIDKTSVLKPRKRSVKKVDRVDTPPIITSIESPPSLSNTAITTRWTISDIFSSAKKQFRTTTSTEITGRTTERTQLEHFFSLHSQNLTSGSVYVSGCPGSGKTALVDSVFRASRDVQVVKINAMTLDAPQDVFRVLVKEISGESIVNASAVGVLTRVLTKQTTKLM